MRYFLSFANWLLETPLLEIASDRNEKANRIQSMMFTLNEHLFKYYLMPDSIYRDHWLTEIKSSFFGKISKLKWDQNKSFFKKSEYYKWLYTNYFNDRDFVEDEVEKIVKRYHKEPMIIYDIDEFEKMCAIFYDKVCFELSTKGYPDLSEIIKIFDTK